MSITFFVMWKVMERRLVTSIIYTVLPLGVFLFKETACGWFTASLLLLVLGVAFFELMAIFGIYSHEKSKKNKGQEEEPPPEPLKETISEGGLYEHRDHSKLHGAKHKPHSTKHLPIKSSEKKTRII
jgi:hypothetical protein